MARLSERDGERRPNNNSDGHVHDGLLMIMMIIANELTGGIVYDDKYDPRERMKRLRWWGANDLFTSKSQRVRCPY